MKKRFIYDLVNPIIPFPKDEWKIKHQYSFFNLISFYQLEVETKADLEHLVDSGQITKEKLYEVLVKDEKIDDEEQIILIDENNDSFEVEPQGLKKFFIEEIYDYGFNDYFFILPKAKMILILNHDSNALRCDFSQIDITRKYWNQYRVKRIEKLSREEVRKQLGNNYRYELCLKHQPISRFKLQRISKELEPFGLTVSDLEEEDYPTENHLLTKKQINVASPILEKHLLEFLYRDKQKDKMYLRKVKM